MIGKRNVNGLLGCWPDSVAMYITFYSFLRYLYSVHFLKPTIKKQIKSKQEKKKREIHSRIHYNETAYTKDKNIFKANGLDHLQSSKLTFHQQQQKPESKLRAFKIESNICAVIFIATLFIIAKTWKQLVFLQRYMNKENMIDTHTYTHMHTGMLFSPKKE